MYFYFDSALWLGSCRPQTLLATVLSSELSFHVIYYLLYSGILFVLFPSHLLSLDRLVSACLQCGGV